MGLRHVLFRSAARSFAVRTLLGTINERLKRAFFSFDAGKYALPLLANPFTSRRQCAIWSDKADVYEYEPGASGSKGDAIFSQALAMIEGRVGRNDLVFDIGCNSGYFLGRFHDAGYVRLAGLDPQKRAIEHLNRHRPYIRSFLGFFGEVEHGLEADLVTFFSSIDRIPYSARLFDAIAACARKYVMIVTPEFGENFKRDWHFEMARIGFMCIAKRVLDAALAPVGVSSSADFASESLSFFLFRRIET